MKKIFTLLMVASMFSLVACGPSEEESAATETEAAAAAVEELFDGLEEEIDAAVEEVAEVELAEHVCNDNCSEEACSFVCGEKGHECSDACHAEKEGEHVHAEGEEHDHS
jgi:predicted negative regulator of RcsB-dependent stress response